MKLTLQSRNKNGFIDITADVQTAVSEKGLANGLCMIYVPHTTAGITINESADPAVKSDILDMLNKIVPSDENYRHMEGNSPAHIKASLMGASEVIAVENGQLMLGTWQGIFFCEFDGPRTRSVHIHFIKSQDGSTSF